jgi:hypothetical protein
VRTLQDHETAAMGFAFTSREEVRMRLDGRCARTNIAAVATAALATTASLAQSDNPPLPPPRPDRPAIIEPSRRAAPIPDRAPPGSNPAAAGVDGGAPEDPLCRERLVRLGVRFEERPPVRDGACSVQDPVLVSGLPDGVQVRPPALMTCPLAEALARWSLDIVSAEADRQLGSAPTSILIGTSYECRNQRSGSKMSEHAFGNGVDIMGFEFAKRAPIAVGFQADGSPEGAFQTAVQKGACAAFTTVLGPGSDAAHGDHLHLDMRGRRGGYRICQ